MGQLVIFGIDRAGILFGAQIDRAQGLARAFQPLGGTESRRSAGKIIAATNRDRPAERWAGRFREDFYYRLCSDQLATPSLREQLDASPDEWSTLVTHIAGRLRGEDEAAECTRGALAWIEKALGAR